MKKSAQVVMLSTNEKGNGSICKDISRNNQPLQIINSKKESEYLSKHGFEQYNLYFLSDEEIKEGDWVCNIQRPYIKQCQDIDVDYYNKRNDVFKKIIATTDSSLVYNHKELHEVQAVIMESSYHKSLPQPSQDFLKVFVEEYNKGNVITEVMVEYEWNKTGRKIRKLDVFDHILKINPDNTININMPKDSWSREEVIELIQKYSKECTGWPWIETDEEWIEENL